MKKFYILLLMAVCIVLSANAQNNIMFVASDNPLTTEDQPIYDMLESLGYTITVIADDNFASADYTAINCVVISETCDSKTVNPFKDAGYPTPAVCMEGFVPRSDRWGWLTDDTNWGRVDPGAESGLSMVITDNTHYITATFDLNATHNWSTLSDAALLTSTNTVAVDLSSAISDAVPLIEVDDVTLEGKSMLWAIPENSTPLSERFVLFGVDKDGLGANKTAEFDTILKRSVEWALGAELSTPNNISQNSMQNLKVSVYPNPTTGHFNINFVSDKSVVAEISISNAVGQNVLNTTLPVSSGKNSHNIDASELIKGLYTYSLIINDQMTIGKILIIR